MYLCCVRAFHIFRMTSVMSFPIFLAQCSQSPSRDAVVTRTMIFAFLLLPFLLSPTGAAFAPSSSFGVRSSSSVALFAQNDVNSHDAPPATNHGMDRRSALSLASATALASTWTCFTRSASAADPSKVVVAGATGQTGRRILERLAGLPNLTVIGGVRNVDKAEKSLSESSTVVRGAMVQQVASVDTSAVSLKHLDVVMDSADDLAATLDGAEALVIATGFVPSNPLKMNAEAHQVDNVGTCRLIDAAKKAGITKVVMVSSILTNGRNWGQEKSPGFIVTNAFGNVLDEKIVAENYLRKSGMDYTIVRPGGLKAKPPSGALIISKEDTLNAGEVSRDLVADVCVASLTDKKASNKVLEIIEDDGAPPKVFNGLNM